MLLYAGCVTPQSLSPSECVYKAKWSLTMLFICVFIVSFFQCLMDFHYTYILWTWLKPWANSLVCKIIHKQQPQKPATSVLFTLSGQQKELVCVVRTWPQAGLSQWLAAQREKLRPSLQDIWTFGLLDPHCVLFFLDYVCLNILRACSKKQAHCIIWITF